MTRETEGREPGSPNPNLDEMPLDMRSSVVPAGREETETSRPPERERPASLVVALSANSAILLAVALAVVVYVGQKRIKDLTAKLSASYQGFADEKAGHATAEERNRRFSSEVEDLTRKLHSRERELSEAKERETELKALGKKTKSQLVDKLQATAAELKTTKEDLATAKAELEEREAALAAKDALQEQTRQDLDALQSRAIKLQSSLDASRRASSSAEKRVATLERQIKKLHRDQAREEEAVKKLLAKISKERSRADQEQRWRKALVSQLNQAGIAPVAKPAPPKTDRARGYPQGAVGEHDIQ